MCKVQMLRALVEQRLTAAAEEIFGLFERTIAEYEEELCRSKEENERQRELLDAVFNPQLRVHRPALPPDDKSQIVINEEQRECSSSVDQQESEAPPHIKEEQEELWSSQEGEQLQGLEEADITELPFTLVHVKSEDDEDEDVNQLSVVKEKVPPEQQECSSSVDQQEPESPPHIKEEQEELWSCQEREQLQGLEEADITKFLFTPVPVKCEDDDEEAQSSQLHQRQTQHMETKADGEDCGGPEPAKNSYPLLHPETEDQPGNSSEPETDDSANWKETREPQSTLNVLKHDSRRRKTFSCSECGRRFGRKQHLQTHMRTHTEEKPFSCSECGKRFGHKHRLQTHMTTHTGEKPFSCSVCRKSFTQSIHLKMHMITHTGEKTFSCPECGKRFGHKQCLQTHMTTHTGERPFSCSVCEKSFTQSGNLQRHMKQHTGEKPFSCSVCEKTFTQSGNLQKHMKQHTGEKAFSCSVCNESFKHTSHLQYHMKQHTGEEPSTSCVSDIRKQQELSSSVDQEQPEPPPHFKEELWSSQEGEQLQGLEVPDITKCPFTCGPMKSEDDEDEDVQHLSMVKEEVLPEQQECSSRVDQQEPEAPPHIKEEHEELWNSKEGEQLQGLDEADITKFPFTSVSVKSEDDEEEAPSSQLHQRHTQHIETEADGEDCGGPEPARNSHLETGDSSEPETDDSADWKETREPHSALNVLKHDSTFKKTFSCSECGRRFGRKQHLQTHMRTHTGEKPFSCSICKKSFTVRGSLKQHMRIHTGQMPYSCSECGKRFNHVSNLKSHLRTHTGEKPFCCSVCDQRFCYKTDLKSHMITHTGEKAFSCSGCNQSFGRKTYLNRHMKTHTGEKPFSCSVCDQRFGQRSHLKRHMLTHTGEKAFSCSVCKKSFRRSSHLQYHMKQHTGEEPSTSCVGDIRKQQEWSSSVDQEQPENLSQVGTL